MRAAASITSRAVSRARRKGLPGAVSEPPAEFASRAKAAWARLIRKVYELSARLA